MIRLHNVRKIYPTSFGDKLVLDGINFEIAKGERLGVLGRNGAGKSTMIRLISGAEKPTSGSIERHMSVSWPLAFGGAFQLMLTGRDNVRFISRIYGQDFRRNLAFVEEFAELGPYLNEPVRSYSSGMRARLAFAISMIIEFDCFLIDEIAAVGDARFHARCNYELFEKRADRAMVIISHDTSYVRDNCNRFAVLIEGRMTEFNDFESAYNFYGEQIGLAVQGKPRTGQFASRARAIDAAYQLAISDEAFRVQAHQGDLARNRSDWADAEKGYASALALHPYERAYWAQLGHAQRAQGKLIEAELSYRTASALGLPPTEIASFLESIAKELGVALVPFAPSSLANAETHSQKPTFPEIEFFAELLWAKQAITSEEAVELMRTISSFDELVVRMINDDRFKLNDEEKISYNTLYYICLITLPNPNSPNEDLYNSFKNNLEIWKYILAESAFLGWPLSQEIARNGSKLQRGSID